MEGPEEKEIVLRKKKNNPSERINQLMGDSLGKLTPKSRLEEQISHIIKKATERIR